MPWRGIYSGLPIEFKIDDKDFLEQVYDQEIKFGNGTSITCNLQIETKTTIKDDIEEAKNADRVILLNKGEIIDCDKPQKIFTNEKLLKELKLDIPFSLKIARKLQKKGYQIKDTLDVEELEKQLCQLRAKV